MTTSIIDNRRPSLSSFPVVSFQNAHSDWVNDIIQLNDGTLLKSIRRWTANGKLLDSFLGHWDSVRGVMAQNNWQVYSHYLGESFSLVCIETEKQLNLLV
eukprot:TRINITY_DN9472_c1_g1_i1.p1 TRINITY_DN9472_c1_g1~~TRINITY_DN9472_c1_g1_i1.p1  ORF type:complete len:100 (+),score=12.24 TRINITY_DN9472_c1_g1_i1:89-388(+)